MSVLDVLVKAREMYAANPSHAHVDKDVEDGCVCLLSATADARALIGADFDDEYEADRIIRDVLGVRHSWPDVAIWNADHSTEEGLAALDRAIEKARP